jgi:predicted CoA-binding protein
LDTARRDFQNPTDEEIRDLLERARTIAVLGLSPWPHRPSHRIATFLIDRGYRVFGVRPDTDEILGRPCFPCLADIPEEIDLVDVFRRRETLAGHTEEAIAAAAPALWFQLGLVDEDSALRAQDAGIEVVMNRCILVEHGRLIGT